MVAASLIDKRNFQSQGDTKVECPLNDYQYFKYKFGYQKLIFTNAFYNISVADVFIYIPVYMVATCSVHFNILSQRVVRVKMSRFITLKAMFIWCLVQNPAFCFHYSLGCIMWLNLYFHVQYLLMLQHFFLPRCMMFQTLTIIIHENQSI